MQASYRVIKNSIWLIIQPLVLNIMSIVVIGYIARTLGQIDYGKFVFALSFITMFMPLANMGLRILTVREIAKDRSNTSYYLGRIAVLRFFLAVLAMLLSIIVVNCMGYPANTKLVVYIASFIIVFQSVTTTFTDVFQAYEEMRYVAQVQFISGLVLTLLSVAALYAGFGLVGLISVYCFGNLLGFILSFYYLRKQFAVPRMAIDLVFWKENLIKGIPFFFPTLVVLVGNKIGIIMLSKMMGDASVGTFGAANNLIEKLLVIPDGICTAFFPALAILYQKSREEAAVLYRKFFTYLFLIGLPIAVGTTVLAEPIIMLIYGNKYLQSVLVLQILVWWLFGGFFTQLQGWSVGAIHQEKRGAIVPLIATIVYIGLSLLLIPILQEAGLAIASVASILVSFGLFFVIIHKHLTTAAADTNAVFRIILANAGMASVVFLLRKWSLFISVPAGALSYTALVISLRIVDRSEMDGILKMVRNKFGSNRGEEDQANTVSTVKSEA